MSYPCVCVMPTGPSITSGARAARKHRRKKKQYLYSLNNATQLLIDAVVDASDEVKQLALQTTEIVKHIENKTVESSDGLELLRRMKKRARRAKKKIEKWSSTTIPAVRHAESLKPRARRPNHQRPCDVEPPPVYHRKVPRTTQSIVVPMSGPVPVTVVMPKPPESNQHDNLWDFPPPQERYTPQSIPLGANGRPSTRAGCTVELEPETFDMDTLFLDPIAKPMPSVLLAFIGKTEPLDDSDVPP